MCTECLAGQVCMLYDLVQSGLMLLALFDNVANQAATWTGIHL